MTGKNPPRRPARGNDQLRALTLGLAAVPDPEPDPEPEPTAALEVPPEVVADAAPAAPRARRPGPMKAEQKAEPKWGGKGAQINLTVNADMKRALALAQIDDGIETTARIRAMIQLWRDDPRLAARVAKLAETLKGRNAWRG